MSRPVVETNARVFWPRRASRLAARRNLAVNGMRMRNGTPAFTSRLIGPQTMLRAPAAAPSG
jgi:hypothetical protein